MLTVAYGVGAGTVVSDRAKGFRGKRRQDRSAGRRGGAPAPPVSMPFIGRIQTVAFYDEALSESTLARPRSFRTQ
jgi:hypothetical protein